MKCSDLFMCSVKLLMGEADGSALGGQKGWTQTGGSVLLSEDAFSGSTPLLTLPPPGTCFILSLEPHRDCTLLKSNFLSRICTWKVDMWGEKKHSYGGEIQELRKKTITGEEVKCWRDEFEAQGSES